MTDLQDWVGRERRSAATLDPWPVQALAAVLDLPLAPPVDRLPGLWHWLYFLETAAASRIGADGHPQKGDFLPPVAHPRRMFAGGRTTYRRPLLLGQPTELVETVSSIVDKPNARGGLTIVTVTYHYLQAAELCIEEQRDFIYLPAVAAQAATVPVSNQLTPLSAADWSLDVATDPVLLMRFSALTFNSHRIHYDARYAREQEGYPDLVVHGPLSAILLSELARMSQPRPLQSFEFRARSPLFVGQTLRLRGGPAAANSAELAVYNPEGAAALTATVTFAE